MMEIDVFSLSFSRFFLDLSLLLLSVVVVVRSFCWLLLLILISMANKIGWICRRFLAKNCRIQSNGVINLNKEKCTEQRKEKNFSWCFSVWQADSSCTCCEIRDRSDARWYFLFCSSFFSRAMYRDFFPSASSSFLSPLLALALVKRFFFACWWKAKIPIDPNCMRATTNEIIRCRSRSFSRRAEKERERKFAPRVLSSNSSLLSSTSIEDVLAKKRYERDNITHRCENRLDQREYLDRTSTTYYWLSQKKEEINCFWYCTANEDHLQQLVDAYSFRHYVQQVIAWLLLLLLPLLTVH